MHSDNTRRPRPPFLVVGLSPTFQTTMVFERFLTGEVNRAAEVYDDLAGKGANVARVLSQLGEEVIHLTYTGGGESRRFHAYCDAIDISLEAVPGGSGFRTCVTAIDRPSGTATELIEPTPPVGADTERLVLERFYDLVHKVGTVVLSGSTAPGFSSGLFARLTDRAREAGAFVCVDYRGEALHRTLRNGADRLPNVIKVNLAEFVQTFFHRPTEVYETIDAGGVEREEDIIDAAREYLTALRRKGIEVVITRGARATLHMNESGTIRRFEPAPLRPANTIGCGDAFTAGLLAELAASGSWDHALEHANVVAGINATKVRPGTIADQVSGSITVRRSRVRG